MYNHTMATLGLLCVLPLHALVAQPVAPDTGSARGILDGYVNEAITANLALAQQTAALRRANAGVREADGRLLPALGLNARYSEFSGVINIGDRKSVV